MTIAFTEEQRKQLEGILITHIHNMRTEFIAAHGRDADRAKFYCEKLEATERLLPLFQTQDHEDEGVWDDEDDDDEETEPIV